MSESLSVGHLKMVNILKSSSSIVAQPKFAPKGWNLASGLPSPNVTVTRAARLQCPRAALSREQDDIPMLEEGTDRVMCGSHT